MKILFITTNLPYPPTTGGAIRAQGIIEGLRRAGHEITLLCFHDGDVPTDLGISIHAFPTPYRSKWQRLCGLIFSRQADIAKRLYSKAFAQKLESLLATQTFDLIQFEGIEAICYLPHAKHIQPHTKMVFDTFNAEYMLQHSIFEIDRKQFKRLPIALYSYLQIGRIKRYESAMCNLADAVIAVSEEDAKLLRPLCADANKVHILSSGIWVKSYEDVPMSIPMNTPALVFTGKMDYRPNIDAMLWFTEEILPHIHAQMPSVHLYIVGQQPHARLEALKNHPHITVTGKVDSVLPYLYGADIYLAPLRMGSGTRLKLLEAMACGCAIIATSSAASGLSDVVRENIVLADDAEKFAEAILDLLANPQKRDTMGNMARLHVQMYDWSSLLPHLLAIYQTTGLTI